MLVPLWIGVSRHGSCIRRITSQPTCRRWRDAAGHKQRPHGQLLGHCREVAGDMHGPVFRSVFHSILFSFRQSVENGYAVQTISGKRGTFQAVSLRIGSAEQRPARRPHEPMNSIEEVLAARVLMCITNVYNLERRYIVHVNPFATVTIWNGGWRQQSFCYR